MGLTISVNGQTRFIAGGHGAPGQIAINGQPARLDDALTDEDSIVVTLGSDGATPAPRLKEVAPVPESVRVSIDGKEYQLPPQVTVNGKPAAAETVLKDRDQVTTASTFPLSQVLKELDLESAPAEHRYQVNGSERSYRTWPKYSINAAAASADSVVSDSDEVSILQLPPPTLAEVLGIDASDSESAIHVLFNGAPCIIPIRRYTIQVDGQPAEAGQIASPGKEYKFYAHSRSLAAN